MTSMTESCKNKIIGYHDYQSPGDGTERQAENKKMKVLPLELDTVSSLTKENSRWQSRRMDP